MRRPPHPRSLFRQPTDEGRVIQTHLFFQTYSPLPLWGRGAGGEGVAIREWNGYNLATPQRSVHNSEPQAKRQA